MAPKRICECGECHLCRDRVRKQLAYRADPEKHRERSRASRERHIDHAREYDRERGYREVDQQKIKARRAVASELRAGRLTRGPCEVEGCTKRAQAHHDDYSKPLDVRWLCPSHHARAHHKIGVSPA